MSKKFDSILANIQEGASVEESLNVLTESLELKVGEKVSVSHGIYAGWRGTIKAELPGGFFDVDVEGQEGSVPVPGFALGLCA